MMLAALPLLAAASLASDAFKAGDFTAAQRAYTVQWQADPRDLEALLGLTQLAIYENRLAEAQRWLDLARGVAPNDPRIARYALAIASYGDTAIDVAMPHTGDDRIPFVTTDPLPSVHVVVDDRPATFLIDTGAPNIVLDTHFASTLGLNVTGSTQGTFAGGRHAAVSQATVARLDLGSWTIANVPASVLPVGNLLGPQQPIDGILGTGLFSHFVTTLDYRNGVLILRDKAASAQIERAAEQRGATIVPMWLVSDHFIFVRARAGSGPESLFNVDTGGTFVVQLTKRALEAANITLESDETSTGMGGGGATAFVPFTTSVTVGSLTEKAVDGIYTPQGNQYGIFPFTVAGTISHRFFRNAILTFDFSAMRLIIEPA